MDSWISADRKHPLARRSMKAFSCQGSMPMEEKQAIPPQRESEQGHSVVIETHIRAIDKARQKALKYSS